MDLRGACLAALALALPAAAVAGPSAASSSFAPAEVRATRMPVFPPAAIQAGFSHGEAKVVVEVDEAGRLTDILAVSGSHPAFGAEAVRCVQSWKFLPARRDGRAVPSARTIEVNFQSVGSIVIVQTMQEAVASRSPAWREAMYRFRARTMEEVDTPPRPLRLAKPSYPDELRRRGIGGPVEVTYYIDEDGRARVPSVGRGAPPELAERVAAAVRSWKFEPARVRGRPVLLRVTQTIRFSAM